MRDRTRYSRLRTGMIGVCLALGLGASSGLLFPCASLPDSAHPALLEGEGRQPDPSEPAEGLDMPEFQWIPERQRADPGLHGPGWSPLADSDDGAFRPGFHSQPDEPPKSVD